MMSDKWGGVGPDQDCKKCNGTGVYIYSTIGTPLSTICGACCPHDEGFWLLTEHFTGYREGRETWCCKRGCGFTQDKEQNDG